MNMGTEKHSSSLKNVCRWKKRLIWFHSNDVHTNTKMLSSRFSTIIVRKWTSFFFLFPSSIIKKEEKTREKERKKSGQGHPSSSSSKFCIHIDTNSSSSILLTYTWIIIFFLIVLRSIKTSEYIFYYSNGISPTTMKRRKNRTRGRWKQQDCREKKYDQQIIIVTERILLRMTELTRISLLVFQLKPSARFICSGEQKRRNTNTN